MTTKTIASKKRLVWLTIKLVVVAYFAFYVLRAIGAGL